MDLQTELQALKKRIQQLEEDFLPDPKLNTSNRETFTKAVDFRDRMKIPSRSTTPATCRIGEMVEVSGTFYNCTAADTWTAAGGGTPGGSDTQVQFNDGGSFGGDSNLTWDKTNNVMSLSSGNGNAYIQGVDGTFPLDLLHISGGTRTSGNGNGGKLVLAGGLGSGTGKNENVYINESALDTAATGPFLVLPRCAGTPTGAPAATGAMVYDSTNNKLWVYDGGWIGVALA